MPVPPVAYAGDARFGGPAASPAAPPPPGSGYAQPSAAPSPAARLRALPGAGRPTSHLVIAAVAAFVLLVGAVLVVKSLLGGSDSTGTGDGTGVTGGLLTPGNPQVAAMRTDVVNIATAEETVYTDTHGFVAAVSAKGSLALGGHAVRLSAPGESVRVVLGPSGTGYCIRATRTPAGGGTPQVVVYVSTLGGMQPAAVKTCPAAF